MVLIMRQFHFRIGPGEQEHTELRGFAHLLFRRSSGRRVVLHPIHKMALWPKAFWPIDCGSTLQE
jgi:hypothetical protein